MAFSFQRLLSRLTFRQLQVFQAVYELRGYRAAAERLNLTQPAVSLQIKKIEDTIDQPLFEYIGRKLYTTKAGEHLALFIEDLFDNLNHLQHDLDRLHGQVSGTLNISVVASAQPVMPLILEGFIAQNAEVQLNLHTANRTHAIERLENNLDDFIVIGNVPHDKPLNTLPFLDNELIAIVGHNPKFDCPENMSVQDFFSLPMIMQENDSCVRAALEQYCQQKRININQSMAIGGNESVKTAVILGLGAAVVPKISVFSELQIGLVKQITLTGFPLRRSWCLVYPKTKRLNPVARAFYDYLRAHIAEINQHYKHYCAIGSA